LAVFWDSPGSVDRLNSCRKNLLEKQLTTESEIKLFLDLEPRSDAILEDVIAGLSVCPKSLPSKYFYDARGSKLFDEICTLDEYYPTRTELSILETHIEDIVSSLGDSVILVEYGSGSSIKTRLLLEAIPETAAYVPIDISREHLIDASVQLKNLFPDLTVLPVCADYSQVISLDLDDAADGRISVFFPGSTIGNFSREHAVQFMSRVHQLVGVGGGMLIGVDLVKDERLLHAAYNDSKGVTAAFNKNMLSHINDRLGSSFLPSAFDHRAFYDPVMQRIEMQLVSRVDQRVRVNGNSIQFCKGEAVRTEYSHKYCLDQFERMSTEAGFVTEKVWLDENEHFAVQYLRTI
jgi:dimethylhistidine N-methyltransferase